MYSLTYHLIPQAAWVLNQCPLNEKDMFGFLLCIWANILTWMRVFKAKEFESKNSKKLLHFCRISVQEKIIFLHFFQDSRSFQLSLSINNIHYIFDVHSQCNILTTCFSWTAAKYGFWLSPRMSEMSRVWKNPQPRPTCRGSRKNSYCAILNIRQPLIYTWLW